MRRTALMLAGAAIFGLGVVHPLRSLGHAVEQPAQSASARESLADIDLSAVDPSVDVCQNFYRHACGGFIARTKLTSEQPTVGLADEAFETNLEANLRRLFTVRAPPGSELGRLETFYNSCLNDDPSNRAIVKQWLARIDAAQTRNDIQALIRALSEIGVDPFFSYSGKPDPQYLHKYRGEIDSNNLWADPSVIERTFILVGTPAAKARSDANRATAIITELRKHRASGDDPADYENPRTLAQLRKIAPAIDWPRYFAMVRASPARPVNLTSADYLPAVSHELKTRPLADLRAYLRWAFLFSLRGELPARYNRAFGDINPALRVSINDPAKRCRDATVRAMGVEFSRQYSKHILGLSAREAATSIAASIRDEIVKSVEQADWLSPAARKRTAEKLRRTDLKIGFPDHWPAVGNFLLDRHTFLANVLSARKFEAQRAWHRSNQPRDGRNWDMLVQPWVGTGMAAARLVVPNGFPDAYSNSLIMTAAFLTPPRFDSSAAPELNYASFGDVFAHEFVHIAETHDFDASGQQQELWSESDVAAAQKQHQCVIDQANAYPSPPGVKVSGASNVDENVADLGGLRLAYNALAAKLGARLNQSDRTGMTPAKRFFYKYAQSWCTAATPDELRKLAEDDPHGLPEYRVNGPLSNLPAFGETFGCRAGSPMRRTDDKICRVW